MSFNGEILFQIVDKQEFFDRASKDLGFEPTKTISSKKASVLGRTSEQNIWLYKVAYIDEHDLIAKAEGVVDLLLSRKEVIIGLAKMFERVELVLNIRSDLGQIGFYLPSSLMAKLSALGLNVGVDIISFGMASD